MTHIKSITRRARLPEKALEFSDIRQFFMDATAFVAALTGLITAVSDPVKAKDM